MSDSFLEKDFQYGNMHLCQQFLLIEALPVFLCMCVSVCQGVLTRNMNVNTVLKYLMVDQV